DELAKRARENDPLIRFQSYLKRKGLLTDAQIADEQKTALDIMADAITRAEAMAPGTMDDMFRTIYATQPPAFARDAEELRRSQEDRGN
ncbi:MAG: hypothetical protein H7123_00630, partial [Thermoleophilia bacterium]|nr:hypothetical protein [Thermoleophilia bacterium]